MSKSYTEKSGEQIQQSIVGTILLNPAYYYQVEDIHPIMFSGRIQEIANDIWVQIDDTANINTAILAEKYGTEIYDLSSFADVDKLRENADLIKSRYLAQEDIKIWSDAIIQINGGGNYFEVSNLVEAQREALHGSFNIQKDNRIQYRDEAAKFVTRALLSTSITSGLPWGYEMIDRATLGMHPGDMILLPARPGMGKTDHALDIIATNLQSDNPQPVGMVSLEMTGTQIAIRLAAKMARVPVSRLLPGSTTGQVTSEEMEAFIDQNNKLAELNFFCDDKSNKWIDVKNSLRKMKYQHGIKLAVIDYLQMIAAEKITGNGNYEVQAISRGIKALAKELEIPFLVLSQLSRAVENRPGKRPQMSDLRDSGSLEQDADTIIFPFRPEYYGIMEDVEGNSLKGLTEMIIAKNRLTGRLSPQWTDWRKYIDGRHVAFDKNNWIEEVGQPLLDNTMIPARRVEDNENLPF